MINVNEIKNPNDRLNLILEKILRSGIKSLNKNELDFLKSYSIGKEEEFNKKISDEENRNTFISDDGNFIFKLDNIEYIDSVQYINGTLIVPDLKTKTKTIKGELKGSIIVFSDHNIAIDFNIDKYDVFEFVSGLEYELDCFIDELIYKIK